MTPPDVTEIETPCPAVSPTTTRAGRGTLIFGLILLAAGGVVVAIAGGLIADELTVPREVVMAPGVGMLAFGLYLAGRGAVGTLRQRRGRQLLARHPDEPWRGDHDWSPEGARESSYGDIGATLVIAGFCFLFLAPFNWLAFLSPDRHWFFALIVGLFDLLAVVAPLGVAGHTLVHTLRYGGAFVRFDRFPFFLGETLSVRLGSDRAVGKYSRLVVTLRCLEVRRVVLSQSDDGETVKTGCYQRYAVTRELPAGELTPGTEVEATFELPRGDYATELTGPEPRFWTIDLNAETPGLDFKASFLVPVYKGVRL